MNISFFDQTRKDEKTPYGESVRLSNELRPIHSFQYRGRYGYNITVPTKWGFDCETAPYSDFKFWLYNRKIKKSSSLFWFVIRIMCWRFEDKHTEIRARLSKRRLLEFDLILSQMKKENEWMARVSYQNLVELDSNSSLNIKNIRVEQLRNGNIISKKK